MGYYEKLTSTVSATHFVITSLNSEKQSLQLSCHSPVPNFTKIT